MSDKRALSLFLLLTRLILRNGAVLLIPPMLITFGLWSKLPAAFGAEVFWKDIPNWLAVPENILRIIVFAVPAFLTLGIRETGQKRGWMLYACGIVLYLLSYLLQIYLPDGFWSKSIIGFTAPAWSTLFWFAGIGLVCDKSWLPIPWSSFVYIALAVLFLIFHIGHTLVIFSRIG